MAPKALDAACAAWFIPRLSKIGGEEEMETRRLATSVCPHSSGGKKNEEMHVRESYGQFRFYSFKPHEMLEAVTRTSQNRADKEKSLQAPKTQTILIRLTLESSVAEGLLLLRLHRVPGAVEGHDLAQQVRPSAVGAVDAPRPGDCAWGRLRARAARLRRSCRRRIRRWGPNLPSSF